MNFDGTYHSSYETGNGILVQEKGELKNAGDKEKEAEEVQGSVSWTAPDGQQIKLDYVANENGYQPKGAHLPVGPEIPAPILRALEWIEAHPPKDNEKF